MQLVWDPNAWEDYLWWQPQDRRVLKRINHSDPGRASATAMTGIGKPEPLKHDFAGYWSRRITEEHRLVYKIADSRGQDRCLPLPLRALTREVTPDKSVPHHLRPRRPCVR